MRALLESGVLFQALMLPGQKSFSVPMISRNSGISARQVRPVAPEVGERDGPVLVSHLGVGGRWTEPGGAGPSRGSRDR